MSDFPISYIDYLVHFHATRDFFECHELLEEHWKQETEERLKPLWVGLIQVAVGAYHHRRENFGGAAKMWRSAARLLDGKEMSELGLDGARLVKLVERRVEAIENGLAYEDLELPITNRALVRQCVERCRELGVSWLAASNLDDPELIHRHTRRDRSEVIRERQRALSKRQSRGEQL